jgi:signal transduction histidine kinase/ligand-binding sensor domain-containing protein/CheY-like chemotaxis protein
LVLCRQAVSFLLAAGCALPVIVAQPANRNKSPAADFRGELAAALQSPGALQSRIRFEHITSADGLSNDSVLSILQDHYGYLWFGTQGGLNRYDGYQMTQYRHDPKSPNSIGGDVVQGLFEDSRGGIWTIGGPSRFDRITETFTRFAFPPDGPGLNGRGAFWAIEEDRRGFLWLGTSAKWPLYRMEPDAGRMIGHEIGGDVGPMTAIAVFAMVRDDGRILWLGTSQGLVRFDPADGSSTRFPFPPELAISSSLIRGLARDKTGNLWLAVNEDAPILFDPVSRTFSRRWPAHRMNLEDDWNGSIFAGVDGILWRGQTKGLAMFDTATGAAAFLRNDPGDSRSLSAGDVLSVAGGRDGSVWVGTKGTGVSRFSPAALRFGAWRRTSDPGGLSDDNVRAILRDRAGVLWIGTYSGGLNRFDSHTGQFTVFRNDPQNPRSLDDDRVYSIYEDRSGTLWIGTGRGINRLDNVHGAFTHFRRTPADIPDDFSPTYSLLEDRTGKFWFGTSGSYGWLNRKTGAVMSIPHQPGVAMHEDRHGNIWLSPPLRLDAAAGVAKEATSRTALDQIPQVNFFHEDSAGILWLATEGGLFRFDPATGKYASYTRVNGLPDNIIQCILPDRAGNLWLSTNSGISRFNPRENSFTNYHEGDGLQSEIFNRKACFADPSGMLYFGGVHGFNAFDPQSIAAGGSPSVPVVLTGFSLNGEPGRASPGLSLSKPLSELDALNLSHRQNGFSFEFAALNYDNQAKTRYRFLLEGLESQWTDVDSRHRLARYTDLAPGTYRFRVQASTNGRNWNKQEASIGISISSPWWMTWWFRAFAILAAAGLLAGLYQLRIRDVRRQERRLQAEVNQRTAELVEARNQAVEAKDQAERANQAKSVFLAHMSHELRNPLSSILAVSSLLQEDAISDDHRQSVGAIHRSGEHLLTLINDVLDLAKIEAGKHEVSADTVDLVALTGEALDIVRAKAEEKNLALLSMHSPGIPRLVTADALKLRQVLINLLGNAVKFTDSGQVILRVSTMPREDAVRQLWLRLDVEDTGIGIGEEDRKRIFEPFLQAEGGRMRKGAGLGLAITREFVEMMGGRIAVESALGQGSRFTVELPVEVAHASLAPGAPSPRGPFLLANDQPEWRVLLVEDDAENATALKQMLHRAGFQVRLAVSGMAGIEAFQAWRPQFLWMDLRMPEMSGVETARRIRELPEGRNVKISAITASAFVSEREQVLSAGMDDFVRKPYYPEEIFLCMERHLGLRYR